MACFHAIILSALMAACEILPIGILSVFTPTFLHHYDIFPYSLIFVIFSKGLFFIAAYLLIFFFKKETYHPQKDWHSLLLLFTPVATIFTLATLIKVGEYISLPSSINILAKKPSDWPKGLVLCGIVEFYAILSLLASMLMLYFLFLA